MPDFIYWTAPHDFTTAPSGGAIRRAPLAGGGTVETLYDAADGVNLGAGLAIDPAGERIYWANYSDSTIRRAPLDGSGTPDTLYDGGDGVSDPWGIAIDSPGGRIYWSQGEWATSAGGTIRRASVTGSGTPDMLYGPAHGVSGPVGVAIDPAGGRIYWANSSDGTIRRAPLAGGTPDPPLYGPTHGVSGPAGVAIDPAAGRIYWTSVVEKTIRGAPITPGGNVEILYDSAQVWFPGTLAIDPTPGAPVVERLEVAGGASLERLPFGGWIRDLYSRFFPTPSSPPGRIYWANGGDHPTNTSPLADSIRGAPVTPGGSVDRLYGSTEAPMAVALLRAPVGTGPPMVSWSLILDVYTGWQFGGGIGGPPDQQLTCSRGGWAADLPGAFLFRAPQSFAYQWRRDGTDIGGANSSRYIPNGPGNYTCRVTASNAAGSASQTSATFTVS